MQLKVAEKAVEAYSLVASEATTTLVVPSNMTEVSALITSAITSAQRAEELGLKGENILLSCKVSGVQDLIAVYRELARRCDYALHLGLTEAGMGTKGTVASTAALSVLLQEGIGDTIRVSLTPQPGEARTQEVVVASEILQALGLRVFVPSVTACPGCGRTTSTVFQELAKEIDDFLRAQMPVWRKQYPGVESMKVAVMGCIVNGPGEAREADLGVASGNGKGQIFIKGKVIETVPEDRIVDTLLEKANEIAAQMEADGQLPATATGPVVVPVTQNGNC